MARSDFQWMIHQKKESQTWEISNLWRRKVTFFSVRLHYQVYGTVENLTLNEDWLHVILTMNHVWVFIEQFSDPKVCYVHYVNAFFLNEGFYSFKEMRDWLRNH